jgi:hypothetical protein
MTSYIEVEKDVENKTKKWKENEKAKNIVEIL